MTSTLAHWVVTLHEIVIKRKTELESYIEILHEVLRKGEGKSGSREHVSRVNRLLHPRIFKFLT